MPLGMCTENFATKKRFISAVTSNIVSSQSRVSFQFTPQNNGIKETASRERFDTNSRTVYGDKQYCYPILMCGSSRCGG